MRRVRFVQAASGLQICLAEVAETFFRRFVGLQGRRKVAMDAGMWILPTSGIHTFGMRLPIDALALDPNLRVVGVCPGLQPWRVGVFRAVPHSVLELAEGRIRELGLKTGDSLRVE